MPRREGPSRWRDQHAGGSTQGGREHARRNGDRSERLVPVNKGSLRQSFEETGCDISRYYTSLEPQLLFEYAERIDIWE